MKKWISLICGLFWLLIAWQAQAATIYIIPDTFNTGMPSTPVASGVTYILAKSGSWPTSKSDCISGVSDIDAALAQAGASGTAIVSGGVSGVTYVTTALDATDGIDIATAANRTFRIPIASDPDYASHAGNVMLDGTGLNDTVLLISAAGTVVNGIIVQNCTAAGYYPIYVSAALGVIFNDVTCRNNSRTWYSTGASFFTANRCRIYDYASGGVFLNSTGAGNGATWNYCIFERINIAAAALLLLGDSSSVLTVNNCLFAGNITQAVRSYGAVASTVVINNSVILANNYGGAGAGYTIANNTSGGGTCTINNSMLGGGITPTNYTPSTTTINCTVNNQGVGSPRWTSPRRRGFIAIAVDDAEHVDSGFFGDLCATASTYGIRITNAYNIDSGEATDWATMLSLISTYGAEFACHTFSHPNLTMLDSGMQISCPDATTATATISGNRLTTSITGGTCSNLDVDLTQNPDGYTNSVISSWAQWIDAQTGYTAASFSATQGTRYTLAASLADVAGVDIKSGVTIALNPTKFYNREITDAITTMETNLPGYTVETLICPGDYTDATARDAMAARGLLGARGNKALGSYDFSYGLQIYNIYDVYARDWYDTAKVSVNNVAENTIRQYTAALAEWVDYFGHVVCLYDHGADACSTATWAIIFDELKKSGVQVGSMGEAVAYARANGAESGADGLLTYTKTFADADNYLPTAGSPLINAGVNVGLTSDFLQNPIRGLPDIGAYEYQRRGSGILMSLP